MNISSFILPILIILLFIYSYAKKVPIFSKFVEGAEKALKLVYDIFPYIVGIFIAVSLFRVSGLSSALSKFMQPITSFFGIPSELTEFIAVRPLSGSGSLALLESIYKTYGADSYIARCASVIMGSSETIFYVTAVYFSGTKVKKLKGAIPIALTASLSGTLIACLLCRIM